MTRSRTPPPSSFPVEVVRISRPPEHLPEIPCVCVYRYATEADRDRLLVEEARVIAAALGRTR